MSRKIKFRAWHKTEKCMIKNVGFSFGDCGMSIELERPMIADEGVFFTFPADDFELMQFTGLRDKNGKEIYEGDIVRCFQTNDDWKTIEESKGSVEWSEWMVAWSYKRERSNTSMQGASGRQWEVIGNIHENGDLLKVVADYD